MIHVWSEEVSFTEHCYADVYSMNAAAIKSRPRCRTTEVHTINPENADMIGFSVERVIPSLSVVGL